MKERVIVAPGLNKNDFLKSLALRGINTFGLRIYSAVELAENALIRSGITVTEEFINSLDENALIAQAASDEKYFSNITYADIVQISSALRMSRSFVVEGEEEKELIRILKKGPFTDKNEALSNVYRKYIKALKDQNKIDSVELIRTAISKSSPVKADFIKLIEFPVSPLVDSLLQTLSNGTVTNMSMSEFLNVDNGNLNIRGYYNCYGTSNEVEMILDTIYSSYEIDKCVVAVSDPHAYSQLFYDYMLLHDIPVTFGTGIPIINSNPAKLLKLYHHWITDGFFGSVSIKKMINSPSFDRAKLFDKFPKTEGFKVNSFLDYLGDIRFVNDTSENLKRLSDFESVKPDDNQTLYYPALKVMAEELGLPCEVFISRYSRVRQDTDKAVDKVIKRLDSVASARIFDELSVVRQSGIDCTDEDIIKNLLKTSVLVQSSEPGAIHLTSIQGALSCLRENLFVAGLSASRFPGVVKENYLVLDEDLEQFDTDVSAYDSEGRIEQKTNAFFSVINLFSGIGGNVRLSYPGLNVSELKVDNPSSVLFEVLKKNFGDGETFEKLESHIKKTTYFEPAISISRKVGSAYNDGIRIDRDAIAPDYMEFSCDPEIGYSPSAIEVFFGCPRKYLLGRILRIEEPEDDNPFEIISAADFGTIAHGLMKELGDNPSISREDFVKRSEDIFEDYLKQHPPLIPDNKKKSKEEFLHMMGVAYDADPHRESPLKEEDIEAVHDCGLKIHGFPDRVEKLDDGSYIVVDFKTKRKIDHQKDDVGTCLQVMIYAYILEKALGYKITRGEYRYLRLNETVTCEYNQEKKEELADYLQTFKEHLERGFFPLPSDKTPDEMKEICKYCKFDGICGKNPDWEVKGVD